MFKKIISLALSVVFSLQTCGFAQVAQLNLAGYLGQAGSVTSLDRFRPASLRYFSYEPKTDNFQILLDKADEKELSDIQVKEKADELMKYFRIGLSLPNEKFWVNLRPDAPEQIIDPQLEQTDIGRIMLEADLQLKKDTASFTSPQTSEGRQYWDKLYKRAGELFGSENITIPTITRPWIVPGEIILREDDASVYIFKANMKVMLEQDHIPGSNIYDFKDSRMKDLNDYSSQLIRELVLPKLTLEINISKRYARLRQVFFSLILSRWFKDRHKALGQAPSLSLVDSRNLNGLISREIWNKDTYYQAYMKSFQQGEYNLKERVSTPAGPVIRSYVSGGIVIPSTIDRDSYNLRAGSPLVPEDSWSSAVMKVSVILGVLGVVIGGLTTLTVKQDMMQINPRSKSELPYKITDMPREILPEKMDRMVEKVLEYSYTNTINSLSLDIGSGSKGLPLSDVRSLYQMLYDCIRKRSPDTVRRMLGLMDVTIKSIEQDSSNIRFILAYPSNAAKDLIGASGNVVLRELLTARKEILLLLERIRKEPQKQDLSGQIKEYYKVSSLFFDYFLHGVKIKEQEKAYGRISDFLGNLYEGGHGRGEFEKHPIETNKQREEVLSDIIRFLEKNRSRDNNKAPILDAIIDQIISDTGEFVKASSSIQAEDRINPVEVPDNSFGGVDFRQMNYLIQPAGSFSGLKYNLPRLSSSALEKIDVDKELEEIRRMASSGIISSGDRFKELLAACFQKDVIADNQAGLALCILEIGRLYEDRVFPAPAWLREALVIVDTGRYALPN